MWFTDTENLCVILISYFERKDTRFCHLVLFIDISAAPNSFKFNKHRGHLIQIRYKMFLACLFLKLILYQR